MAHGRFDNPVVAALAGVRDFFRKQELSERLTENDRADDKTILITGANSGLGFGLSTEFARREGKVIMACRRQIPEAGHAIQKLTGSNKVTMRHLDLSRISTIHKFIEGLKEDNVRLDVVILNAGVALPESRPTESGLEEMFLVNYLSNVILISGLLKHGLLATDGTIPNILFISSDSHQGSSYIDYEQFGTYEKYGVTKGMNYYSYYKLILNTYATELSRRLNPEGEVKVSVNVMCPGPVNSNIIKEAPWLLRKILGGIFSIIFKSPVKAARPVVYMCISDDYKGRTNEYLHMFNVKKMDSKVYEPAEGRKLWARSLDVWKDHDPDAVNLLPEDYC